MNKNGYSVSDISRLLGKDGRTIKKYIIGNPMKLYKHVRNRYNPYENKIINWVKDGYMKLEN